MQRRTTQLIVAVLLLWSVPVWCGQKKRELLPESLVSARTVSVAPITWMQDAVHNLEQTEKVRTWVREWVEGTGAWRDRHTADKYRLWAYVEDPKQADLLLVFGEYDAVTGVLYYSSAYKGFVSTQQFTSTETVYLVALVDNRSGDGVLVSDFNTDKWCVNRCGRDPVRWFLDSVSKRVDRYKRFTAGKEKK